MPDDSQVEEVPPPIEYSPQHGRVAPSHGEPISAFRHIVQDRRQQDERGGQDQEDRRYENRGYNREDQPADRFGHVNALIASAFLLTSRLIANGIHRGKVLNVNRFLASRSL